MCKSKVSMHKVKAIIGSNVKSCLQSCLGHNLETTEAIFNETSWKDKAICGGESRIKFRLLCTRSRSLSGVKIQ